MEYLIAIMSAITTFVIIQLIRIATSKESKLEASSEKDEEEVQYSHLEDAAFKLGIAVDKYLFNCRLAGEEPKLKKLIIERLAVIILAPVLILLCLLVKQYLFVLFVVFASIFVISWSEGHIESKADDKKAEFENCLPRFLDLLLTALRANMPIASAIEITAKNVDCLLSQELLKALNYTNVGAGSWQDALFEVASKYEVDEFSDFVMDVVNSFDKGVSIVESVERQSKSLKQSHLLKAKEKASRMTNTIIFPVTIFKLIPLMAILFLPIILQLMS